MRGGDAFQLGYLPELVRAHFDALEIVTRAREGVTGQLAERADSMLATLPQRGPEIVSCVWQVASLVPTPPQEPETAEQLAGFIAAAAAAAPRGEPAYELGAHVGATERLIANAIQHAALWSAARDHAWLVERVAGLRRDLTALAAAAPAVGDCPTMRAEHEAVAREVASALTIVDKPQHDGAVFELLQARSRVAASARALESAAWGTPRQGIRAWHDKQMSGTELMRRFAEHYRWNVPVRIGTDGQPTPRIFEFDKRALFAFSDRPALDARPSLVRSDRPEDQQCLTLAGALLFTWLPEEVDVLVLEATDDQASELTINYQRHQRPLLCQAGEEIAVSLAATDWTELNVAALRKHSWWINVSGGTVHNLLARDPYGRPMVALHSSEAALEAHLARSNAEQKAAQASWQRVLIPGNVLFPELAKLQIGIALDPYGPGRRRLFNRRTVEQIAAAS
jgi:hypothetical protein